jgi:hypothetical protein
MVEVENEYEIMVFAETRNLEGGDFVLECGWGSMKASRRWRRV